MFEKAFNLIWQRTAGELNDRLKEQIFRERMFSESDDYPQFIEDLVTDQKKKVTQWLHEDLHVRKGYSIYGATLAERWMAIFHQSDEIMHQR